jgi:MerR family transcriptional regulator, redox-sensitive transcriptional activator SoxR
MLRSSKIARVLPIELTVGDLARRAGTTVATLHFYEAKGLIRAFRTSGNQRRYFRGTLRRVAVIRAAQQVGIPLAEIGAVLATMPHDRAPTNAEWAAMAESWKTSLDRRIEILTKLRDGLTDCIGCGCLSMELCPLRNPGDRLGRDGAGPRRLLPA